MKVVIVEDHVMFREVLRKVCTTELGLEVVGEAGDGRGAVKLVASAAPDLVLLDLQLPKLDGFGVVAAVRHIDPDVRILALSSHCDEYTVFRVEKLRLQGFVDKNTNTVDTLKEAIRTVTEGKIYFSETFRRIKASRIRNPQSFDKLLTEREQTILTLIGEPMGDAEIANRLGLSAQTVQKHRFNILKKIGLETTAELVRYAQDHGFTLNIQRSGGAPMLP